MTFDNLSYTFNGLGQFILSKSIDGFIEIHAQTEIFNATTNFTGTIFNSFAVKVGNSSIVQLLISDVAAVNPYLSK